MAQILQVTALLWAALVLTVEGRQRHGSLGRGVLVASATYSFLILLLVSATAPPQGALIVAAMLLAHMTLIGVIWLYDRRRAMIEDEGANAMRAASRRQMSSKWASRRPRSLSGRGAVQIGDRKNASMSIDP